MNRNNGNQCIQCMTARGRYGSISYTFGTDCRGDLALVSLVLYDLCILNLIVVGITLTFRIRNSKSNKCVSF